MLRVHCNQWLAGSPETTTPNNQLLLDGVPTQPFDLDGDAKSRLRRGGQWCRSQGALQRSRWCIKRCLSFGAHRCCLLLLYYRARPPCRRPTAELGLPSTIETSMRAQCRGLIPPTSVPTGGGSKALFILRRLRAICPRGRE